MSGTLAGIFFYIILAVIAVSAKSGKKKGGAAKSRTGNDPHTRTQGQFRANPRGRARSTDGHVLEGDRDVTCRRFGHRHPEDAEPRYLVHDDPLGEDYITLNGKRYRLKEADKYFCR